jgi:uncharacterized protein (TIGR03435 family)
MTSPLAANSVDIEPVDAAFLRQILKGLGLTVESRKEPVEMVLIESIERTPTAN